MGKYTLNHNELTQYGLLRSQVALLDENIKEAEDELAEINKYHMDISPVYSGMPSGNEKRDKIGDFIIRLEADRDSINSKLSTLKAERAFYMYSLHKIRNAVNKIVDEQLKQIIKWHYFEGLSIDDVALKSNLTLDGVYKKLNRFWERRKRNGGSLSNNSG